MSNIVIDVQARMLKNSRAWSVAEAKARLSEVIDRALKEERSDYQKRPPGGGCRSLRRMGAPQRTGGDLADFFGTSRLRGSELQIERPSGGVRESNL